MRPDGVGTLRTLSGMVKFSMSNPIALFRAFFSMRIFFPISRSLSFNGLVKSTFISYPGIVYFV